ncbi:MAG: hypothetical protein EOO10_14740 [Chitinophagaceae bacterium]|nr:MAG: hypothetical protein EOO10_14740 [Chitinophagaceae bacterium]
MTYQTAILFGLDFPVALYIFVFCGSVCSYNFHWYLTPPDVPNASGKLKWNLTNKNLHLTLFIVGLLGAAVTALLLIEHWLWFSFTAFFTFLYSAPMINHPLTVWLRRIAVGKTIFLSLAWMHVTALLPLLIEADTITMAHVVYVLNRFFFIYAICIVFDRRDVENDRRAGIKSLITYLNAKGVDRLFWASLILVFITAGFMIKWLSLPDVLILTLPAVIMGLLYEHSKRNTSDYLYYFLLDGLMALSAPILILAKFAR